MGFFGGGKKKTQSAAAFTSTAASPNRQYVAPTVPNQASGVSNAGASSANASQKRNVQDPPVSSVSANTAAQNNAPTPRNQPATVASPVAAATPNNQAVASKIVSDVETGGGAATTNPAQSSSDGGGQLVSLRPLPYTQDQQVLNRPQINNDYDDGTIGSQTLQTYKTLQTAKSRDSVDSKDTAFTITRNGQYLTLNGFANGHLIRWKFAAEEGSAIIRIPAIKIALGVVFTSLWPIVTEPEFWSIPHLICAFHAVTLSFLVIVLEGRAIAVRNPVNARARLRNIITRYLSVLKFVWGRGLLYIYAGSMNLTLDHEWVIYSGFPMMILGVIAVFAGAHASYNLDQLKTSLTDESYLWVKFSQNDPDNDGLIDTNGFAELLWSLGLEFDDMYTFKAFKQIDIDNDSFISFDEFKNWWIVTQNDGKGLRDSK